MNNSTENVSDAKRVINGPSESYPPFTPRKVNLNFSQALELARHGYGIGRTGHIGHMIVAKNATLTVPGRDNIPRAYHIPEALLIDRQDGKGFQILTLDNSDIMALDYYVL